MSGARIEQYSILKLPATWALVLLLGISCMPTLAQTKMGAENYVAAAQSLYWKTLSFDEKQVFLFSYLASMYEARGLAYRNIRVPQRKLYQFRKKVGALFAIWKELLELQTNDPQAFREFISWIDLFYEVDFNQRKPFYEALFYAHRKLKSQDKSILALYLGSQSALPDSLEAEQRRRQKALATSEALDFLDSSSAVDTIASLEPLVPDSSTLTSLEERIINLAVEVECINHRSPERFQDKAFLERLAQKHGFNSMEEFNREFDTLQKKRRRWPYINKLIIERAFDRNCM